jgi:hypothetical protein
MFKVRPVNLEGFRQALFILSYYHVTVTVQSDGSNPSTVELIVSEGSYHFEDPFEDLSKNESYKAAKEQLAAAEATFFENFTTLDANRCVFVNYIGTPTEDPISKEMKRVMEEDVQALFDLHNKGVQEPVEYDFFEDEYHDPGEGPTYTVRRKVWNIDEDEPSKEQVKAGIRINLVRAFIEGMIEQATTKVEPIFIAPDPESLTCNGCNQRDNCRYVDDAYNTDGDCLAMK